MDEISGSINFPGNLPDPELNEPFQTVDIARVALESANIGIWIIDMSTRTFVPSPRTKELFGYLPDAEMSFEAAMLRIPARYRKSAVKTIEDAFTHRKNLSLVYPVTIPGDKKHRWLSILGGCNTPDDHNYYFSGIIMDVTEQKQNDLRTSKFIGIVSHELKTPLTALRAYVQMLNNWAKKQKDQFTIGALSKVEKHVKKMLNMINGLLHLSGAESGKIHLNKQDFLLDELISEVVEETQFITSSDNIAMIPCAMVKVNADREKIEQVIINLLSNAAKYSEKNSAIEISCFATENKVQVNVKDNGMGIEAEHIKKLFEPHYRVDRDETKNISGFGIGLYLCAEIIKAHKGSIWAESELGKGSTFIFTLPLN